MLAAKLLRRVLPPSLSLLVLLGCAGCDHAHGRQIDSYLAEASATASGVMHVHEVVTYDFGENRTHGMRRTIQRRFGSDTPVRVYPIDHIRVRASRGEPIIVTAKKPGKAQRDQEVSIRARNGTLTGRHRYTFDYDVHRVFGRDGDAATLRWVAIGSGWKVPIRHVRVRLSLPIAGRRVACSSGGTDGSGNATGPLHCGSRADVRTATFVRPRLRAGHWLAVTARTDAGTVRADPMMVRTHLGLSIWTWFFIGLGGLALVIAIGAVVMRLSDAGERSSGPGMAGPADGEQ